MQKSFEKITRGYKKFRDKYSEKETSLMQDLAEVGQHPEIMFVACCDSRVDPALLLQGPLLPELLVSLVSERSLFPVRWFLLGHPVINRRLGALDLFRENRNCLL